MKSMPFMHLLQQRLPTAQAGVCNQIIKQIPPCLQVHLIETHPLQHPSTRPKTSAGLQISNDDNQPF